MCEIEDLLRDEIPLRDLVQAAVTATAHAPKEVDRMYESDDARADARGEVRRAKFNDLLLNLPRRRGRPLQVESRQHEGGRHYTEITSESFVITVKLLNSPGQAVPYAGYRQLLALEMPLFAGAVPEDTSEKAYLVLTYCVSAKDPGRVCWIAIQDPGGQLTIDLAPELEQVESGVARLRPTASPREEPKPQPKLRSKERKAQADA